MTKKVSAKAAQTKKSVASKPSKPSTKTKKAAGSTKRKATGKKSVAQTTPTKKFSSAKTGRIVKSSPAVPRLGIERIQAAVRSIVNREGEMEGFSHKIIS